MKRSALGGSNSIFINLVPVFAVLLGVLALGEVVALQWWCAGCARCYTDRCGPTSSARKVSPGGSRETGRGCKSHETRPRKTTYGRSSSTPGRICVWNPSIVPWSGSGRALLDHWRGWTLDSLAHLAAWEILLDWAIVLFSRDHYSGAVYRVTSYDEINAHLHARYKDMAPADVRRLLQETHAKLVAALEASGRPASSTHPGSALVRHQALIGSTTSPPTPMWTRRGTPGRDALISRPFRSGC